MKKKIMPALMALGLSAFAMAAFGVAPSSAASLDDVLAELKNLRRENAEIRSELAKLRRASTPRQTEARSKPVPATTSPAAPQSVALRAAPPVYSGAGVSPRSVYTPVRDGVYDWGGFYGGFNLGYGMGTIKSRLPDIGSIPGGGVTTSDPTSSAVNGPFAGLQLGYNFQRGPWVAGIEGDVQYGNISGPASIQSLFITGGGTTQSYIQQSYDTLNMFATLRGRLGYAFDRFLPYVTGGAAVGMLRANGNTNAAIDPPPSFFVASKPGDQYVPGWALGGGFEYGLSDGWSIKAEYLHLGFREKHAADSSVGLEDFPRTKSSFDIVRGGMNYHF
jgi:outer membrane immunogenic protein